VGSVPFLHVQPSFGKIHSGNKSGKSLDHGVHLTSGNVVVSFADKGQEKIKALHRLAPNILESFNLALGFNTFGNNGDAQGAAQLDDQVICRLCARIGTDAIDERFVDLDRVDRIAIDIAQ
jgi:hypothetical protein